MATTRIFESDRELLQGLSKETGKQHQEIIHEALEQYHRDRLLDQINSAFARLKADHSAWQDELEERRAWDGAIADGLVNGLPRE